MIETGIKTLKINAIKINKTLADGNKSMKKLRAEEQRLFRVQQNKIKLKQREDLIEDKKKPTFGSGIAKKVIQPVRSFIDKLKDFFILLGKPHIFVVFSEYLNFQIRVKVAKFQKIYS